MNGPFEHSADWLLKHTNQHHQSINDTIRFEDVCDNEMDCFPPRDLAEFQVRKHSGQVIVSSQAKNSEIQNISFEIVLRGHYK